jgi:hypothetical protein
MAEYAGIHRKSVYRVQEGRVPMHGKAIQRRIMPAWAGGEPYR